MKMASSNGAVEKNGFSRHGILSVPRQTRDAMQKKKKPRLEDNRYCYFEFGFLAALTSFCVACCRKASSESCPMFISAMHNVFSRALAPRITSTLDLGSLNTYIFPSVASLFSRLFDIPQQ